MSAQICETTEPIDACPDCGAIAFGYDMRTGVRELGIDPHHRYEVPAPGLPVLTLEPCRHRILGQAAHDWLDAVDEARKASRA